MKFSISVINKKQTASFRIASWLLAIAPLWLMLAAVNTSAHAQTSNTAAATSTTTSSPADWTEFHRDNMQRWNPYETALGESNAGSLQLKWKRPLGAASSPAVVNGVIYFGSYDQNVYALNATTGATVWSYTTGSNVESSPAVANGVVYVGSDDGNVYALNASTGALLWSFATGGGVDSSPAVANGVVYVGSGDGNVYALNASTGAKLWSYSTAQADVKGNAVESSPAVANGVVFVGSDDGNLYALNASTGAKLWSDTLGFEVMSSPAVANGVVYVSTFPVSVGQDTVFALNASTGAQIWRYVAGSGGRFSSPAVANGVVYVPGGGIGAFNVPNKLFALNASTGGTLWSYSPAALILSSPAVANGVVYVGSSDGNIYALNVSRGAKLWSYAIGGANDYLVINSSPTVVDGVLYIAVSPDGSVGSTGNFYAFAPKNPNLADLFLRIRPTLTTVHQGDLLTYAFPVWNLGPDIADQEVLNTQVPEGTVFDYIRISGTPGLGTCTHTLYLGAGPIPIVCHENSAMALNTTWTVRLTVKVTAPAGTVITESAATMADTPDPNMANNTATVSLTVVP